MAVRFEELKSSVLIVLYDYMLTSDHETFWFSVPSIQEGLPAGASGALAQRAISSLVKDGDLEAGSSDGVSSDIYALTESGIETAEFSIEERGMSIEEYEPAPSADVILSRFDNPTVHAELNRRILEFKQELDQSNSASEILGGDCDIISSEVEIATQIADKDRIRVSRLQSFILPTLRYIADKFSGQAIGEAAKQLIIFLIGLN